jgi:hypothetical protein
MDVVKTVPVRLIDDYEIHLATAFQEIVNLGLEAFPSKGKGTDLAKYKIFKKSLIKYSNYPFVKPIMQKVKEWDIELIDIFQAKRHALTKNQEILKMSANLTNLFLSGNIDSAYEYAKSIENTVANNKKRNYDVNSYIGKKHNPLHIENPLFFGRYGLLNQFEKDDMIDIKNKNLNEYKWTYLSLPENKMSDFEYIVHWIQELKNNPNPVELSPGLYNKYSEFTYSSSEFEELKKTLEQYLHGNNKNLIPKIIELLNKIPDLNQTNEDQKEKITEVYRGIAIEEGTTKKNIVEQEKRNKFVATSKRRYTAKKFAFRLGHLESMENRRSDYGAIITYETTPDSILIDTSILGGVFGESEVIIDVSKAKIKDIDFV